MASDRSIVFYYGPHSRSLTVLSLLEELGAPYELKVLNLKTGEQRQAPYLAINPMGKVPAVQHAGAVITEQVAIFLYLADLFAETNLVPPLTDPLRGPYLRWMVYYAACFEPAILDRSLKRNAAPQVMCPYGDFEAVLSTVSHQLKQADYLLGERFSAADILWGIGLAWMTAWKIVPELPEIMAYAERINARPSVVGARAKDDEHAAAQSG